MVSCISGGSRGERALSREGIAAELHGVHLSRLGTGLSSDRTGDHAVLGSSCGGRHLRGTVRRGHERRRRSPTSKVGVEAASGERAHPVHIGAGRGPLHASTSPSSCADTGSDEAAPARLHGDSAPWAGAAARQWAEARVARLRTAGRVRPARSGRAGGRATECVAASWSFLKLLEHWRAKHARVAFVPSEKNDALQAYRFGQRTCGWREGASFNHLLRLDRRWHVSTTTPVAAPAFDADGHPVPRHLARSRNQWRVHVRIWSRSTRRDAGGRDRRAGRQHDLAAYAARARRDAARAGPSSRAVPRPRSSWRRLLDRGENVLLHVLRHRGDGRNHHGVAELLVGLGVADRDHEVVVEAHEAGALARGEAAGRLPGWSTRISDRPCSSGPTACGWSSRA